MSRRSREGSAPITLFSFQDLITSLSGILILLVLFMALEFAQRKDTEATAIVKDSPDHSSTIESLRNNVAKLKQDYAILKQSMESMSGVDAVEYFQQVTKVEIERDLLHQRIDSLKGSKTTLEKRLKDVQKKNKEQQDNEMRPLKEELTKLRAELVKMTGHKEIFFLPEKGISKNPILIECSDSVIRVGFINRDEKPTVFVPNENGFMEFKKHLSCYSPTHEYFVFMIKPSGVKCWGTLSAIVSINGFDVGYDALEESSSIGFSTQL